MHSLTPVTQRKKRGFRWIDLTVCMGIACGCAPVYAEVPVLVSSVLPSSRSVQVDTPATVFATLLNAGIEPGTDCSISMNSALPVNFTYQTTNPADNLATGTPNTPVDIAPGGFQTFVLTLVATEPVEPQEIELIYQCENSDPAGVITGVNTIDFSASDTEVADVIALVATPSNDGIVELAGAQGTNVFGLASVNVGVGDTLIVNAEVSDTSLPVSVIQCQTDPATAVCINPEVPSTDSISTEIAAQATPTFGFFVTADGDVPFDPATNRVFVRFTDQFGATRGSTSVALRTVELTPRLDSDFATEGVLVQNTPASGGTSSQFPSEAIALADGKILIASFQTIVEPGLPSTDQLALLRLTEDGAIDTTFADEGVSALSAEDLGVSGRIRSFPVRVVELSDGRLRLGFGLDDDIAVIGLLADGSLDTSFGTQGSVVIDIAGRDDDFSDMAALSGGAIVLVGDIDNPITSRARDPFVLKITPDGSLDSTFGNSGVSIVASPGPDIISNEFFGVTVGADGKITAVGVVRNSVNESIGDDLLVARFLPDGSLDSDFATDGVFILDNGTDLEVFLSVAVNQQGEVFATGEIQNSLGLLKLTSSGVPDSSFGNNGFVLSEVPDGEGQLLSGSGNDVVLLEDGRILVLGSVAAPGRQSLTFSLFTATGDFSLNFGQGGRFNSAPVPDIELESTLAPLALDAQGRVIVVTELETDDFRESDLQVLRFIVQ